MTLLTPELIERRERDGLLTKDANPAPFVKADAEQGIVDGYASKWWKVDSYGEATEPGSFAKTILDRGPQSANPKIVLRYEHQVTIGTHRELKEDATGLFMSGHISDDGMFGTAVRAHLKDDVPYGISIGYKKIGFRSATADDPLDFSDAPKFIVEMAKQDIASILVLTEQKLAENSIVTFPAVDAARVTNYRSDLDLTDRAIEMLLRDVKRGILTDAQLDQLRRLALMVPAVPGTSDRETRSDAATRTEPETCRNYVSEARLALLGSGLSLVE